MSDSPRILVVEDDPALADLLCAVVEEEGVALTDSAPSVRAARAMLGLDPDGEPQFSAVLLDIGLPDGSGIELCRAIRARHPQLPVIVVTARRDDDAMEASFAAGATDYVRKPVGVRELLARLRAALVRAGVADPALDLRDRPSFAIMRG
jgi:DNA-binding response OmpR family regulator